MSAGHDAAGPVPADGLAGAGLAGAGLAGAGLAGAGREVPPRFLIRNAQDADVEAIVAFEIEIAVISFADEAITDPDLHRRRVTGALGRPGEVTLVGALAERPAEVLGWAWLSARTNSLTGAKYGNFRSLAVADVPGRPQLGELLLGEVLAAAEQAGLTQLTGKVHAANLGMRALYRKFGFTATHLTMERNLLPAPGRPDPDPDGPGPDGTGGGHP